PHSMRILASICNKRRSEELKHPGVFLYEIDTQREEVRPIDLGDCLTLEVEGLNGATGLSHFRRGFLVALQSEPSLLLHLRRDYSVQNIIRMSKVRSARSVVVRGDSILVVSTGSDSVVEIRGDQRERIFWCDNLEGCDSIHVNSLAWHRGELYLCAFGRKEGELWSTASCGYIQNVA